MFKNFSPGLFFSMAAVTVTVFAPFIMIFHPIFQMEYFSYNNRASTFIPNPVNLRLILLACLVLIIMLGILAYKRNMKIYVSGIFLFGLSVLIAYLSTQNYLMISQDKIERHHFFTDHQYQWNQLDEIVFEYVIGSKAGDITFTTKSGDQFIIKEKEVHSNGKSQIYHLAKQNDVNYIEREKK
ncbi:acyl dehydratase [Solibacillus merdavium]|uniref:Acyl dehydratase n=1 Tax=Solibacillus merdavium TaxID=2762218 RepID=A0ABR8XSV9_9BACL|nr:acyl dehydratase [Solibacillus merdavium]MBD8035024.1 acyl dehydratase [Solibacillus merdavium]